MQNLGNFMDNKGYAVFLDIDSTLLWKGTVPEINIKTIDKVRKAGHYVFINTARSYGFIPQSLLDEVPLDGVVAGIGTDLRLCGKQIESHTMKKESLKQIAEYFMGTHREVGFEGENTVLWINPSPERHKKHLIEQPPALLHSPEEFDTVYKDEKISKMYIRGHLTPEEYEFFGKENIMYQHEVYAEFVPKGFGKAVGMLKMLKYIDIPTERCIAMGDSGNDEDMLKAAGISVAMGNATAEIKSIADFISTDAKDGGVAYALEKIILT
ncbi:MAG: HAD family hydrolase [Clostridiales bacterium]|nr:HAD family hydrolase [Clostridiales bacterium]